MINIAVFLAMLFGLAMSVNAEEVNETPAVTQQQIDALFGPRLERGERQDNLLLLAIAFDHHSEQSPTRSLPIGIPFIVSTGPGYWVRAFQEGDRSLEVLVNNALLLLYLNESDSSILNRREAASVLMEHAYLAGYWPAGVFLAESKMEQWHQQILSQQHGLKQSSISQHSQSESEQITVLEQLTACSRIRFAPCVFQLGYWYVSDPDKKDLGMTLLQDGVEIVRRDDRYASSEESMMDMKAALAILARPSLAIPKGQ